MFGIAQRGRFGVDLVGVLTDVGAAQDGHPLGIGGHQAILNAVVHQLDEVASTAGAAVEITLFGSATQLFSAGSSGDFTGAWSQGLENRIKPPDGLVRTADHHAVTALQAPDAPARPNIHVMNL